MEPRYGFRPGTLSTPAVPARPISSTTTGSVVGDFADWPTSGLNRKQIAWVRSDHSRLVAARPRMGTRLTNTKTAAAHRGRFLLSIDTILPCSCTITMRFVTNRRYPTKVRFSTLICVLRPRRPTPNCRACRCSRVVIGTTTTGKSATAVGTPELRTPVALRKQLQWYC
jgi:hypothetical protein